jgi:hypothetical protein
MCVWQPTKAVFIRDLVYWLQVLAVPNVGIGNARQLLYVCFLSDHVCVRDLLLTTVSYCGSQHAD